MSISQFGWQFEKQFYSKGSGVAAVNEWVLLVGGLDQGVMMPSASWMVGLSTREGTEFGVGPNVTPAGVALAFAAGVTHQSRDPQRADERRRGPLEGRRGHEFSHRLQHAR